MSNISYRLDLILKVIEIIEKRSQAIKKAEDFIKDDDSETILDSINARLQSIGENLNKIVKVDKDFCMVQLRINPFPIIDFRNIVPHEYELLDYQIIYKICTEDIPLIKQRVQTFLSNNNEAV